MSPLIIDNFLPECLLNSLLMQFPEPSWKDWYVWDTKTSRKKGTKDVSYLPVSALMATQYIIEKLSGEPILKRVPDCGPDLDFHGSGFSLMESGCFVNVHTDAESHPTRPWRRTHSLILYLDTCNSGYTTFNHPIRYNSLSAVTPVRNRLLLFSTQDQYHGVTKCFETQRRTLNLFYWKPEHERERSNLRRSQFTECHAVIDDSTTLID